MPGDLKHFKIGDYCWMFDGNRRVYVKDNPRSLSSGPPLFEGHFVRAKIVDETRVSWIVQEWDNKHGAFGVTHKFRKDGGSSLQYGLHGVIYTDAERAEMIWENANRWRIVEAVKRVSVSKLRRIADILEAEGA